MAAFLIQGSENMVLDGQVSLYSLDIMRKKWMDAEGKVLSDW